MKPMDLLDTIGSIQDKYILQAEKVRNGVPSAKKQKAFRPISYRIAAMFALVLAGILFLQTPIGVAAVELVKDSISRLIESIFPPKEIIVMPGGTLEVVQHEAQGRDPQDNAPGFVMYIDTENYVMTEENGSYYVRQIPIEYDREEIRQQQSALLEELSPEEQEAAIDARIQELTDFYASLPVNEIEIREVPGNEFSAYAEEVRNQASSDWETVTAMSWIDKPLAYTFSVSDGTAWDSTCEVHYFVDTGRQGTFHIIARYRLEAAEDLGSRFTSMIQTFEVVTAEDVSHYTGENDNVLEAMREEVNHAMEQNETLLRSANQSSNSQSDLNEIAQQRYTVWLGTMDKLWMALEQKLDFSSMQDLLYAQFEWSVWKATELDKVTAEARDETLAETEFYANGSDMLEERVYHLLSILEGTTTVPPRDSAAQLAPETVISEFLKAYYAGDRDSVKNYLTASYNLDVDVYTDFEPAAPEIDTIKGLETIVHDMTDRGTIRPYIQFRITPDSDYFMYLSMTLTWEDGQWKVSEYGLEG